MNIKIKDNSFHSFLCIYSILITLYLIISNIFINNELNEFKNIYVKQNIALCGSLISSFPSSEENILKVLSGDMSYYNKGYAFLSKYSYSTSTDYFNFSIIKDYFDNFKLHFNIVILVNILLSIGFIFLLFYLNFNKIKYYTNCIIDAYEQKYALKLCSNSSDSYGKFEFHLNNLFNRSKDLISNLEKEKVILIDTLADISHQVKTPISSLIMINDIFKNSKNMKEEDKLHFIQLNYIQLERIDWLVKNLLKLTKLDSDIVEFNFKQESLIFTIQKSLEYLDTKLLQSNIKVELITNDYSAITHHDSKWICEAFINILKNSIEHSKDNSTLTIEIFENKNSISILFKDCGSGISKDDLPNIFKRFYRGKNPHNLSGVGIGLPLSKKILEKHYATIDVKNTSIEGTVIEINFTKLHEVFNPKINL